MAKAILIILTPLNIFFWLFEYISKRINGIGIDESVFYHMRSMQGAGYADFNKEIIIGVLGVAAMIALIFFIYRKNFSRKSAIFCSIALGASTFFNTGISKTADYIATQTGDNEQSKPVDFQNTDIRTEGSGRNLVYLYLESFENTYTDPVAFPGLTPHINALKKKSFHLENAWMPYGTNWTIAGMVGSQCGLPLTTDDYDSGNSLQKITDFLPQANCLGDILKNHGYTNYYYGGADSSFGGKNNFYSSHGFSVIQGIHEIETRHPIARKSSWGIYDDDFFSILKKEFSSIKKIALMR